MQPTNNTARLAGALYVLLGVTAPFGLLYVPHTLIVRGNATATATNILGSEMLFRLGIVAELATAVLLHGVNKMQASLTFVVNEIFWDLWLLPFGLLLIKSRFIPRILGILLIADGFAYVIVSLTSLLLPVGVSVLNRYALIAETGELWVMLWLLIKGAKVEPLAAAA